VESGFVLGISVRISQNEKPATIWNSQTVAGFVLLRKE
jgi:hypothetical protein